MSKQDPKAPAVEVTQVPQNEVPKVDPFAEAKKAAEKAEAKLVMVIEPTDPRNAPALRVDH